MNKLINLSLAAMAISTSACATVSKSTSTVGRIIEFKSDSNGFDTKSFFYEGENEVIAFDAQFTPELAQSSIKYLRKFTNKPITWLVITHPNPDKFNGASAFKAEGARILSSESTANAIPVVHAYKEYYFVEIAKMFKKAQYPQPVAVDQTFKQEMELVLRGGERIGLRELSHPGISSTQTVAYIKTAKALFVGDLVHNEAHAWLEGGIVNGKPVPTISGWISDLEELSSTYPSDTMVYGGRGKALKLSVSVRNQIVYLQTAKSIIDTEIESLGAKATEFNGPNAGTMYKSLAAKFQMKFPTYEIPYMIEYGAYGLVQFEMHKLN